MVCRWGRRSDTLHRVSMIELSGLSAAEAFKVFCREEYNIIIKCKVIVMHIYFMAQFNKQCTNAYI